MVSIHSEMRVTPEGEPEVWANLGDILDWLDTLPENTSNRIAGAVAYHCYSSYARGTEFLMGYYAILDRTPKGRDESGEMWLRRHDEYDSRRGQRTTR